MGERWNKIKDWFARRAMFKIISEYMKARAKTKIEILMRGFGGMLTIWTISIFAGLIAIASGLEPQWGIVVAAGLGATSQYLVEVYRILFGKPIEEVLDEEVIIT